MLRCAVRCGARRWILPPRQPASVAFRRPELAKPARVLIGTPICSRAHSSRPVTATKHQASRLLHTRADTHQYDRLHAVVRSSAARATLFARDPTPARRPFGFDSWTDCVCKMMKRRMHSSLQSAREMFQDRFYWESSWGGRFHNLSQYDRKDMYYAFHLFSHLSYPNATLITFVCLSQ